MYYENAEKIVNIPAVIIQSFGTVMLPKMSNLVVSKDCVSVNKYIDMSMKYIMCIAIGLAFGVAAVSTVFAPVFWGEEFVLSGYLIMGLSISIPFIAFANIIRTQYLLPAKRDKDYLISVVTGALVNLIVNYFLIQRIGSVGAMIGTVLAESIVCILQTSAVRKELPVKKYVKSSLQFTIIGFCMFGIVHMEGRLLGSTITTLFIQLFTGALIFCSIIFAFLYKTNDEIILSILKKDFIKK